VAARVFDQSRVFHDLTAGERELIAGTLRQLARAEGLA